MYTPEIFPPNTPFHILVKEAEANHEEKKHEMRQLEGTKIWQRSSHRRVETGLTFSPQISNSPVAGKLPTELMLKKFQT